MKAKRISFHGDALWMTAFTEWDFWGRNRWLYSPCACNTRAVSECSELRAVKVAPQVMHSGRGWGGSSTSGGSKQKQHGTTRGPAESSTSGGSKQQGTSRGRTSGGSSSSPPPPPNPPAEAAGGVGGAVGGLGRMQHLRGNYKAIRSILTRPLCCRHKGCRAIDFDPKYPIP